MSFVRLRTLTLKSKLGFGKYSGYTVKQIISIDKASWLAWTYYNSSNISFTDDILNILGITIKIIKPGVDRELWETIGKEINTRLASLIKTTQQERWLASKSERVFKEKNVMKEVLAEKLYSNKGVMKYRNQHPNK